MQIDMTSDTLEGPLLHLGREGITALIRTLLQFS